MCAVHEIHSLQNIIKDSEMQDNFEVKESAELGRYSVVTRDVVAGEILFEEYPFVVGPKPNTPPVCLVCCRPVNGSANGPRCKDCNWPLCQKCTDHEIHRKECKLFVEKSVKFQEFASSNDACMQLDCITPLRLLLEKESNRKRWEEISLMEHHEQYRRQTKQWKADQTNIVEYLLGRCKLRDRFSENLIQQACGILEVNSFEARTPSGFNARCIFPKTAIMAHSCVPNTAHTIYPSDQFKITVRASVDINQGDIISTTYTNLLVGTSRRQEHLKNSKFFECKCKRCSDPTELGTHFSSFKCNKCGPGLIYSAHPFDQNFAWKCNHCDFNTSYEVIRNALTVIQSEVDYVQCIDFGPESLKKCEALFRKYLSIFHSQHYIPTALRQSLIEMYGRVAGYKLKDLPDVLLEHKIELCGQVLNVLNVIHPGKTRVRAMLLYELYAPIVLRARASYADGILQDAGLKAKLQEAINLLDACIEILEWEDVTSVEYGIAQIAKQSVMKLRESIKTIEC